MIPEPVMRELRYLEISTARSIRNARIGAYASRIRGAGFDFDQHLPYREGDDVRRIDWNATARLNAPYVRQTHADRELDLVIALDLSRSMELGGERYSKKEIMTFVSGSLLFSAAADQINAGFLAFADDVLTWSAPRRVTGRAWRVLEDLWALQPQPAGTRLLPAVRHLLATLRTMTIVVLVSDFLTDEPLFTSVDLRMLAARHDVIAVVVEDPADTELPPGSGYIRLRDVERRRDITVALNERTRTAYGRTVEQRRRAIADRCHALGISIAFVRSDRPALDPLIELFARRARA